MTTPNLATIRQSHVPPGAIPMRDPRSGAVAYLYAVAPDAAGVTVFRPRSARPAACAEFVSGRVRLLFVEAFFGGLRRDGKGEGV